MMKKRRFKITEAQLREMESQLFSYVDDSDIKPNTGLSNVEANGALSDNEFGTPKTSDDIAKELTPQIFNRYRMYSHRAMPHTFRESVENDKNGDGIDDFYNNEELDILGDGDDTNNLTKIPKGIENKANILVSELQNLTPKQRAIVLNKFVEQANIREIPYAWKKELSKKVML